MNFVAQFNYFIFHQIFQMQKSLIWTKTSWMDSKFSSNIESWYGWRVENTVEWIRKIPWNLMNNIDDFQISRVMLLSFLTVFIRNCTSSGKNVYFLFFLLLLLFKQSFKQKRSFFREKVKMNTIKYRHNWNDVKSIRSNLQ